MRARVLTFSVGLLILIGLIIFVSWQIVASAPGSPSAHESGATKPPAAVPPVAVKPSPVVPVSPKIATRPVSTHVPSHSVTSPAATIPGGADLKPIEKRGVTLFPKDHIELKGQFCLEKGPVEYLIVGANVNAKAYESVISVNADPEVLHWCMILLGLKAGDPTDEPQFQGDPSKAPTGSPVVIKVKWTDPKGKQHLVRGEDLCLDSYEDQTMEHVSWVFTGSRRVQDESGHEVYCPQQSIVAVYRDPLAVVNLPLASSANDDTYNVNFNLVPPRNTPCTVIIEPGPPPPPQPRNAKGGCIIPFEITFTGRMLLNKIQVVDPVEPLKQAIAGQPNDTYELVVAHHAPPAALAIALDAIVADSVPIERVGNVRVDSKVEDAGTVTINGKGLAFNNQSLAPAQAAAAAMAQVNKTRKTGLLVRVEAGADLKILAEFLRKLPTYPTPAIRLDWPVKKPETPAPAPKTK